MRPGRFDRLGARGKWVVQQEDGGSRWTRLSDLEDGRCGWIREVEAGDVEIERLQAMSICRGRRVRLVRAGDPLILRVLGTRIGVSARLAAHVLVEPCASDLCDTEDS